MEKYTVFLLLLLTACCAEESPYPSPCPTTNTYDQFPWIADLKSSLTHCSCEFSIVKGTYQGQIVIYVLLTDPLCDGINTPTLFDCDGTPIRSFTSSMADQKEFYEQVKLGVILYRCKS